MDMINTLTIIPLILTVVVLKPVLLVIKSMILGMKCAFEHQDLQMFGLKFKTRAHSTIARRHY